MMQLDGPPVKLRTSVTEERPKSILSFNTSPDIPFDRSINAYRGCEHAPSLLWLMTDRPLSGDARKRPNVREGMGSRRSCHPHSVTPVGMSDIPITMRLEAPRAKIKERKTGRPWLHRQKQKHPIKISKFDTRQIIIVGS